MSKIEHRCNANVYRAHTMFSARCSRKGTVQGNDGKWYCTQHSPAKKAERQAKSRVKWEAQKEKERPKWHANEMLKIIRRIAAGHNHPMDLCSDFLAAYDKKGK